MLAHNTNLFVCFPSEEKSEDDKQQKNFKQISDLQMIKSSVLPNTKYLIIIQVKGKIATSIKTDIANMIRPGLC